MQKSYDAVILGAGASGLFCGAQAAKRGLRVLLLDRAPKAGVKLALTGGGKCNLTNRDVSPLAYYGSNPDFCRSALSRLTPQELLDMLQSSNIPFEEREHGQIFCRRSAKDLRNILVMRCKTAGCDFAFEESVERVSRVREQNPEGMRFSVSSNKTTYYCRFLVVATGSPAWPQCGASGMGYEIARRFGHSIVPIRPALVGLKMPAAWSLAGMSGISLPVSITLPLFEGKQTKRHSTGFLAAEKLPLLFTHSGVSGPAALQASLYWTQDTPLTIDFLPENPVRELFNAPGAGKILCKNLLKKFLPERLCAALVPAPAGEKKTAELSRKERDALAASIHAHTITPAGTEDFSKAEVCAGGVCTEELSSKTLESRLTPGLYFCGEVLDVTGRLGGYNLHWAFASGKAVGLGLPL